MQPAHRFFGHWTLDPARSTYQYGEVPQSILMTLEEREGGLHIRMEIVGVRGAPITMDGLWPFGEGERNATEVLDERTLVHRLKQDGEVTSTMRRELWEDGDTMTVRHEGISEGEPWTNISLFVRVERAQA